MLDSVQSGVAAVGFIHNHSIPVFGGRMVVPTKGKGVPHAPIRGSIFPPNDHGFFDQNRFMNIPRGYEVKEGVSKNKNLGKSSNCASLICPHIDINY